MTPLPGTGWLEEEPLSYDVCAHAHCGDWRTVLHTVRWSGTDQNTGKVRHSIRDQATLHHYYQVPDTIIQMTVDRVRRLPRQDYCHVGMQPAAPKEDKIMTEKEPIAKRGRKADKKEEKNKSEEDLEEKSN